MNHLGITVSSFIIMKYRLSTIFFAIWVLAQNIKKSKQYGQAAKRKKVT